MTCTQPSISAHFCFILMPMFLLGNFPEPEKTATHWRLSDTHWGGWAPCGRAWRHLFWYTSLIKAVCSGEAYKGGWVLMLLSMDTVLTLAALQVMKTFLFLFAVLFFLDPGKENEHLYFLGYTWVLDLGSWHPCLSRFMSEYFCTILNDFSISAII